MVHSSTTTECTHLTLTPLTPFSFSLRAVHPFCYLLGRVFLYPFSRRLIVFFTIVHVFLRNVGDEWVVWQERKQHQQQTNNTGQQSNQTPRQDPTFLHLRGLASVNNEAMDNNTLDTVKAGLQLSFNMSKQICPLDVTLQW